MEKTIEFPYLGKRTYVQSTQLLKYVVDVFCHGQYNSLLLKFQTMLTSKMKCLVFDSEWNGAYDALCIIECESKKRYIYFVSVGESEQKSIIDNILETFDSYQFSAEEDSFILEGKILNNTFYEVLIELNKRAAIFLTQKKEKWIVAQIEINNPIYLFEDVNKIVVKKLSCISNFMLRSEVWVNNQKVGTTMYRRI